MFLGRVPESNLYLGCSPHRTCHKVVPGRIDLTADPIAIRVIQLEEVVPARKRAQSDLCGLESRVEGRKFTMPVTKLRRADCSCGRVADAVGIMPKAGGCILLAFDHREVAVPVENIPDDTRRRICFLDQTARKIVRVACRVLLPVGFAT